jgi:hypothetical protein
MTVEPTEGAYRISGRFGEGYFLDPSGRRPPLKIVEATAITFTKSLDVVDVPLAGNKTGTKDGGEQPGAFTLTLTWIDQFFENLIFEAFNQNLQARRAARDSGQRLSRTFTLQVWNDDPEALGVIGHQLDGCRLSDYQGGFDFGDAITSRSHNGRYERLSQIKSFERLGNTVDPVTGLPAIRYTASLGSAPAG